jgi:hypothetical protein
VTIFLGSRRNDRLDRSSFQEPVEIEFTQGSGADYEASTPEAKITISLLPPDPPEDGEVCSAYATLHIILIPDRPRDLLADDPEDM